MTTTYRVVADGINRYESDDLEDAKAFARHMIGRLDALTAEVCEAKDDESNYPPLATFRLDHA